MKILLATLCVIGLVGCTTVSVEQADVSDVKDLCPFVGQMIVVRGRVTNTRCPYVNGIDVWELYAHRGKIVEATGLLKSRTVTREDIRNREKELGGPYANRGPGTFFSLKNVRYKVIAETDPALQDK